MVSRAVGLGEKWQQQEAGALQCAQEKDFLTPEFPRSHQAYAWKVGIEEQNFV